MNDQRERIAYVQHEIWACWQDWVFEACGRQPDGSVVIPPAMVERWSRQINTSYTELSEREKDSDREQADKVLAALDTTHLIAALAADGAHHKQHMLLELARSFGLDADALAWEHGAGVPS